MKNVIFLVCDGLPYDITIDIKGHKSPMVFLNQLRKNVLTENLFFLRHHIPKQALWA